MTARAAILVALSALLLSAPTSAAAMSPSLSVTLSDGVDQASSGDTLRYLAEIENSGGRDFVGFVRIELPGFAEITASDGEIHGTMVDWPVDLATGESAVFRAEATLGEVPEDAYQVVALASARSGDGSVLVRAADADDIPGADNPPAVPGLADPNDSTSAMPAAAVVGAAILVPVAVAGAIMILVRRRRARPN